MKNKKLRILNYILAVLNLAISAVFYPFLPDQIPMNWNMEGVPTYSDKYQIFLMAGMALLMAVFLDVLPKIDPRSKNYQRFGGYYDAFCIIMDGFMLCMTGFILLETFRPGTVSIARIVPLLVGLLFLFIGNAMPKFKSNFFCGIKTPWALSSEEVWRKTHRLGGKCFFLAGLAFLACAFVPRKLLTVSFWCTFGVIMAASLIPSVMSYVWWKQEQAQGRSGQDG